MSLQKKIKIIYAGGGTMGSVSPLLAIHQRLKGRDGIETEALWIGTPDGPERQVVESNGIRFQTISSGKLRRYFSLKNIIDIFRFKIGALQSLRILKKEKPDIVLSAGGFVAVPVVIAARLRRIPVLIHQQDLLPGLANKLSAPFATWISVSFSENLKDYNQKKVFLAGNPVRTQLEHNKTTKEELLTKYNLKSDKPVLLVVGGGTGAQAINEFIWDGIEELTKFCQVIHQTGRGKDRDIEAADYQQFEFIHDELIDYYQIADVVVSRAGLSFLTELAFMKKASIIIPMPNSHQENNAEYFAEKDAIIYLKQLATDSSHLVDEVKKLFQDEPRRQELGENIKRVFIDYSGEKIIDKVLSVSKINNE